MTTMREYLISQGREAIHALRRGNPMPTDEAQKTPLDDQYYPYAAGALSTLLRLALDELESVK